MKPEERETLKSCRKTKSVTDALKEESGNESGAELMSCIVVVLAGAAQR